VSVLALNGEAVVAVRDRGDGIMADDLPHIFDRFYRSRRHATRRGGFGLGLAFVQKVITAHGGRVSVSSEPGQGAEFRVHLPTA
jgi:two-component system, OmpR family, sensor histidine kinase BaeS